MKKLLVLVPTSLFLLSQLIVQAEEKPSPETIEIVIKIDKEPGEPNPTTEAAWQTMVDTAFTVARQCQDCTERTLDAIVNNVCECIKGMAETMKTNPSTTGSISITIKDSESGVSGSVRKK